MTNTMTHVWQEMTDCCINPQCRANRNAPSADQPCPCPWAWPSQDSRSSKELLTRLEWRKLEGGDDGDRWSLVLIGSNSLEWALLSGPTRLEVCSAHEPPAVRPEQTGVGDYCTVGPASEQYQKFLLLFEDRSRGMCIYTDEEEARRVFACAESRGWNCHLFGLLRRAAQPPRADYVEKSPASFVDDLSTIQDISPQLREVVEKRLETLHERIHGLEVGAAQPPGDDPFQDRVAKWMQATFDAETVSNKTERNHRFLEESLELVQSLGCTQAEAHMLVDYVFGRPTGECEQETGGVMVTLAALANASNIMVNRSAETELTRCWSKIDVIRAKQAGKPRHSPLPGPTLAKEV